MAQRDTNAGLAYDSQREVQAIIELLRHGYRRDAFLREMMQNADDAGASWLELKLMPADGTRGTNPLLHGPLLIVINDGLVRADDLRAMRRAVGGNKSEEHGKVGRFGLGLKSVFHWCEAFFFAAKVGDGAELRVGVVNPHHTPEVGDRVNATWSSLGAEDEAVLERMVTAPNSDGAQTARLALCVPLRLEAHCNRGALRLADYVYQSQETTATEIADPGSGRSCAMVLAQCAHLERVACLWPDGPRASVRAQPGVQRGPGRPIAHEGGKRKASVHDSAFQAQVGVLQGDGSWSAELRGVARRVPRLDTYPDARDDWPMDFVEDGNSGRFEQRRQKALGHGAVSVLRLPGQNGGGKIRARWASFLPLETTAGDDGDTVLTKVAKTSAEDDLELILHGFVFVSPDRRDVYGWTKQADSAVASWNQAVIQQACLPLVAQALQPQLPPSASDAYPIVRAASDVVRRLVGGQEWPPAKPEQFLAPVVLRERASFQLLTSAEAESVRRWHGYEACDGIDWFREALVKGAGATGVVLVAQSWCVPGFLPKDGLAPPTFQEFSSVIKDIIPPRDARPDDVLVALRSWVETVKKCSGTLDHPLQDLVRWVLRCQGAGWGPVGECWDSANAEEVTGLWSHLAASIQMPALRVDPDAAIAVAHLARKGDSLPVLLAPTRHRMEEAVRASEQGLHALLRLTAASLAGAKDEAESNLGESLGTLALDLVERVGLESVAEHTQLRGLRFVRARAVADGREVFATPREVQKAADAKRLFSVDKRSPVPQLEALARVLGPSAPIYAIERSFPTAQPPGSASIAVALIEHREPWSTNNVSDLARLASALLSDARPGSPSWTALRRLWMVDPVNYQAEHTLYFDVEGGVDGHVADVVLHAKGRVARRISVWAAGFVRREMSESQRGVCNVKPLDLQRLLRWLDETSSMYNAAELGFDTRYGLLRLASAKDDGGKLFRDLRLHAIRSARGINRFGGVEADRVFREGATIPEELLDSVDIVDIPAGQGLDDAYRKHVAKFDDVALAGLMLRSERPDRFARSLLKLRGALGKVPEIDSVAWLPRHDGGPVAPAQVVNIAGTTDEVEAALVEFAQLLGPSRLVLSSSLHRDVRAPAEAWLKKRGDRTSVAADVISRLAQGEHARLRLPSEVMSMPRELLCRLEEAFDDLVDALSGRRRVWKLLAALKVAGSPEQDPKVIELCQCLAGNLGDADHVECLNALANSETIRRVRQRKLWTDWLESMPVDRRWHLLPKLLVPCVDRKWREPWHVAASTVNVPKTHCLQADVAELLEVDRLTPSESAAGGSHSIKSVQLGEAINVVDAAQRLEVWTGGLADASALATAFAFAAVGRFGNIVQSWAGDQDVTALRQDLASAYLSPTHVAFFLSHSRGRTSSLPRLCGHPTDSGQGAKVPLEVQLDPEELSWIEGRPEQKKDGRLVVTLRQVDLAELEESQRPVVLKNTCFALVVAMRGRNAAELQRFEQWWEKWGSGSQAAVDPIRRLLLTELRTTLEQLLGGTQPEDLAAAAELRSLVDDWRKAKIADSSPSPVREGGAAGTAAVGQDFSARLEDLLQREPVAAYLRTSIRRWLEDYGYEPGSVLLELLQNADDALNQLVTMRSDAELPADTRAVQIELTGVAEEEPQQLVVRHWGRAINDHGGLGFPQGREQKWDQDLYFMLRLQVSAKAPTAVSDGHAASTGRFGLGFKSVHLISDEPRVRSGTLSFDIEAALLPKTVREAAGTATPRERSGLRQTEFSLPLRPDVDSRTLEQRIFGRLVPIAPLWVGFARQVRRLELPVTHGGTIEWNATPLDGVPGWEVTSKPVRIGRERSQRRLLRLRTEVSGGQLASVVFAVESGRIVPLPSDVPTLWVVAPTGERWDTGYALNGDFKLDPGRARVDLEAATTADAAARIGQVLGLGLCALVRAVDESASTRAVLGAELPDDFLESLWTVLSGSLRTTSDQSRASLLRRLHFGAHGLGALATRAAPGIPSGLPAPWPKRVGPVSPNDEVLCLPRPLEDPRIGRLLLLLSPDLKKRTLLGEAMIGCVEAVVPLRRRRLEFAKLLRAWSDRQDGCLNAASIAKLRVLAEEGVIVAIDETQGESSAWREEWARSVRVWAESAEWKSWSALLPPRDVDGVGLDGTWRVACAAAKFAPIESVAASSPEWAQAISVWVALLAPPQLEPDRLAAWMQACPPSQHACAVEFLCNEPLGEQVAKALHRRGGLPWCNGRDTWRRLTDQLQIEADQAEKRAIDLFGFDRDSSRGLDAIAGRLEESLTTMSRDDAAQWLSDVWRRWSDPEERARRLEELRSTLWPREWKKDEIGIWLENVDHPQARDAWSALLLLATVQGLGLRGRQHRGFVEFLLADRDNRWDLLFGEGAPDSTWMTYLEAWSRREGEAYAHWHRVLPEMYAATRWWDEYACLLRRAHEFEAGVVAALDPRNAPELSGDPDSQQLPRLRGAIRRAGWIEEELVFFGVLAEGQQGTATKELFAPSSDLTEVLRALGFFDEDARSEDGYTSGQVYAWLEGLIGADKATFHGLGALILEHETGSLPALGSGGRLR